MPEEVKCEDCEKVLETGKPCEVTFHGFYDGKGSIQVDKTYVVSYRCDECGDFTGDFKIEGMNKT